MKSYVIKRKEVLFFEVKAKSMKAAQKIADESVDMDYKMEVESIENEVVAEDGKYFKVKKIEKEVVLCVMGGVIDFRTVPKGITIKMVDFDVEWTEGDDRVEKFEGKDAVISEIEGTA